MLLLCPCSTQTPIRVRTPPMELTPRVYRIAPPLIFAVAFLFRFAIAVATGDFTNPHTYEYGEIAQNLLADEGFKCAMWFLPSELTAIRPPLYPLLLAGMMSLLGESALPAMIIVQCLAGAAACLVALAVGRRFFNRATATLGAALLALYPHVAYYSKNIQPQCFSVLLLLGIVYLTVRLKDRGAERNALSLGALYGIAFLLEPSLCAFLPVSLVAAFLAGLGERGNKIWIYPALVLITSLAILSPWTIRNWIVLDRFVPVRSDFGLNLYIGNSEWSTGTLRTPDGRPIWENIPPEERDAVAGMNTVDANRVFGRRAVDYMVAHKTETAGRILIKTFRFWWPFENEAYSYRTGPRPEGRFPLIRQLTWAFAFFPGLLGMALAFIQRWTWRKRLGLPGHHRASPALLFWLFLLYPITYALTVADGARYRLVMEPFFVLLCAYLLTSLWSWWSSGTRLSHE